MGQPAARVGDTVLQDGPHCHANIHPAVLTATPAPHPPMPLPIVKGSPTVTIGGQPAARVGDETDPCDIPACVPGGPGIIAKGSATVSINGQPAARVGDTTAHEVCIGPIPGPSRDDYRPRVRNRADRRLACRISRSPFPLPHGRGRGNANPHTSLVCAAATSSRSRRVAPPAFATAAVGTHWC